MPFAMHLAVSTPALIGIPALLIVLAIVVFVLIKKRGEQRAEAAWISATSELGIQLVPTGAEGHVNAHAVSVSPVTGKRKKKHTQYNVKFDASDAPPFRLIKRGEHDIPVVDTGNPDFDEWVVVQTHDPERLAKFLTEPRRAAIIRTLNYWPAALISNSDIHLTMPGIEDDQDRIVDAVCQLVATAETFDRSADERPAPRAKTETADVLTDVRLDEMTVLNDLFNSGLPADQIDVRFDQVYKGRNVRWTGEVIRVGSVDDAGRQTIAALVGSADGLSTKSGRVVAVSSVAADANVAAGSVLAISGSLANLDAAQRMFHIF